MVGQRVFTTPEKLTEMLRLRADGKSTPFLANKYGVDHTTIVYHCKKHDVHPHAPVQKYIKDGKASPKKEKPAPPPKPKRKYNAEAAPVNRGKKSYADYLLEQKQREFRRQHPQVPKSLMPKKVDLPMFDEEEDCG